MNIFQHLGLDENHRKQSKVTQLVKHYDEVIAKHKDKPLWIQKKEDGVCALAVVGNGYRSCKIFSRTGKEFQNVYRLRWDMINANLPDGVYMGEIVNDDYSLERLSGAVNPNRTNQLTESASQILDNIQFKMFDFVTLDEFIDGKSDVTWGKRYGQLVRNVGKAVPQVYDYSFSVIPAMLAEWGEFSINAELNTAIAKGHEGIVIRDPEAGWLAGHKGWHVMKKVRGVDYDLKCIGIEEGTGKYAGKAANLIFEWKNGETIKCMLGKGWTHDDAEDMFYSFNFLKKGEGVAGNPVGKIFQVYALDESSKGKLRLPKVGELRHDKEEPDI